MVFLKIVLLAIPIYACSFLHQSSLMYHFLYWGVVRIIRKPLGLIGTLFVWMREFNIALLWFKGLSSRYGVEGGRLKKGREMGLFGGRNSCTFVMVLV